MRVKEGMADTAAQVANDASPSEGVDLEPAEMRVIDRLDELRVIARSLRIRILDCLGDQALTVRDLQKMLGIGSTSLYYHVAELERAGLIRLVRTEIQAGIQLKYFRAVARYFYISPVLLHGTNDEVGASGDFMTSLMESTARNLRKSLASGLVDRAGEAFVVSHRQNRMSLAAATEFRRRLEELDKDFERAVDPEGEVSVEFAVALFPR